MENTWAFPALEALHVVGLALLVGTIVLGDLRVLGVTRTQPPEWPLRAGLWIMLATGAAMFLADSQRYRDNPAFLVKITAVAVALVLHFLWCGTRAAAVVSLTLWTFAVVAARAVIDFDA